MKTLVKESRKRHSSSNVMKVANIIIDLGSNEDTSEESDGTSENDTELDHNATFSARIGRRRYTKMLEVLNEVHLDDNNVDELEQLISDWNIGSTTMNQNRNNEVGKNANLQHLRYTNTQCTMVNGHHKSKKRLCEAKPMNGLSF